MTVLLFEYWCVPFVLETDWSLSTARTKRTITIPHDSIICGQTVKINDIACLKSLNFRVNLDIMVETNAKEVKSNEINDCLRYPWLQLLLQGNAGRL